MKTACILISSVFLLSLGSCNIINPDETIPTYVHIDSFQYTPTLGSGTSSHKINSVWVYFDNQPVGVFDLPATFPVIATQKGQLLVSPGVTFSGFNDFQVKYDFFRSDTMTLNPGPAVSFAPKTSYYDTSVIKFWMEDFEFGNSFTKYAGDTTLVKTNLPGSVFEGNYSGIISLDTSKTSYNISTGSFTGNANSFLELNYKCTVPFEVGLQTFNQSNQNIIVYLYGLKTKNDWNKVYIGLSDFINAYPNKTYHLVIRSGTDASTSGYVLLDNIKVVSQK